MDPGVIIFIICKARARLEKVHTSEMFGDAMRDNIFSQAKRARLATTSPPERPGVTAAFFRQAFLVERLLCAADAAEVESAPLSL